MNIIYTDKSKVFSGAEYSLLQLLNCLEKKYAPIICFDYPQPHHQIYVKRGYNHCYRTDGLKWWMGSDRWQHPLKGTDFIKRIIFGIKLSKVIYMNHAQLLHYNLLWPNSFWDLFFAKMKGVKIVGHVRSFSPDFYIPDNILGMCDSIICVSDAVKRCVESRYKHNNIHSIHDPVECSQYAIKLNREEAKISLGLPVNKRIISSVALLSPHKGHDDAIKAFSIISTQYDNLLLYIAGGAPDELKGNNRELERLESLANQLKIGNRVIFTGRQIQDISKVYAASEFVLALTIYGEAFGRVSVEAGAAGKIIIATNLGATPEIVKHEQTGILVPPKSPEIVAWWCKRILDDYDKFKKMGDEARKFVLEKFNPRIYATKIMEIYNDLLNKIDYDK